MALINCPECGKLVSNQASACPNCGCPIKRVDASTEESPTMSKLSSTDRSAQCAVPKNTHSMTWYVLLKCILVFGIILNVFDAMAYFIGAHYLGLGYEFYEMLPILRSLDVFGGVFCFVMAIFTFIVWYSLRNYKVIGPKLLTIMYIANAVFNAIYMFAFSSIVERERINVISQNWFLYQSYYTDVIAFSNKIEVWTIIQIVVAIIMIIVNYLYFKKRSDQFCF